MAKLPNIEWRGITLKETAAGNLEGDSPASQVRLTRMRNDSWTGLAVFKGLQWTGDGSRPEEVLEQINAKVLAARDFLLSDGEVVVRAE